MRRAIRLITAVALIGILQSGCGEGESACSCAPGATYEGSFYQQYANTLVRADRPLGKSDPAGDDCCSEAAPQVTVYSIDGIDPDFAIATKDSDGKTYFNVALDLSQRQQRMADRFAKEHHKLDHQ